MKSQYDNFTQNANSKKKWTRQEVSNGVVDFLSRKQEISQREYAKEHGIPRATLQNWVRRYNTIDEDPGLVAFFESPVGTDFLHLLIHGLHLEFTKVGCGSLHNVCNLLKICKLSKFVASSYGAHQKISSQMDSMLGTFGEMEKARLVEDMPEKLISICEDETFHPEVCLVGIEPESNFILLEKYADDRSAETWNKAVNDGLNGLPVKILQSTSDEGKGLISHAVNGLNAHHSPDIFHVQHEIGKGTSGALAGAVRSAEKTLKKCTETTMKAVEQKEKYESLEKRPVGRRPDFERRIDLAKEQETHAKVALEKAQTNQESVLKEKREISKVYHPYDPLTGEKQDSTTVSDKLTKIFDNIRVVTDLLADRCKKRVDKAWRVTEKMTLTIAFFFCMIESLVDAMDLPEDRRQLMHTNLIPGFYLQKIAKREKDPETKQIIQRKSQELLSILISRNGPLEDCNDLEIAYMERKARDLAGLFQRSSSCVEGRNAQLSLRHHGMHRLSEQKLNALTVIHNYYLKRPDGTTAAERFYENKPIDMFEWLLGKMPQVPRPKNGTKKAA
jgi:hypothetical protein